MTAGLAQTSDVRGLRFRGARRLGAIVVTHLLFAAGNMGDMRSRMRQPGSSLAFSSHFSLDSPTNL